MHPDVKKYNDSHPNTERVIFNFLAEVIGEGLPESGSKVWHAHPVWFIDGNPIVGYNLAKDGVRLMFWSGQSFESGGLKASGSFKVAETRYRSVEDVDVTQINAWLSEAREIQWDYKNIRRRKGKLERLK